MIFCFFLLIALAFMYMHVIVVNSEYKIEKYYHSLISDEEFMPYHEWLDKR